MKNIIFLSILFSSTAFAAGAPSYQSPSVDCSALPSGALSAHRNLLSNGTYGFCVADSCDTTQGLEPEPYKNRCLLPPFLSWFSKDQSISLFSGSRTVVLRAQRSRPSQSEDTVFISTSHSTFTGQISIPSSVSIPAGQTFSDPITTQISGDPGVDQNVQLDISDSLSSSSASLQIHTLSMGSGTASVSELTDCNGQAITLIYPGQTLSSVCLSLSKPLGRIFPSFVSVSSNGGAPVMVLVPPGSLVSRPFGVTAPATSTSMNISVQLHKSSDQTISLPITSPCASPLIWDFQNQQCFDPSGNQGGVLLDLRC